MVRAEDPSLDCAMTGRGKNDTVAAIIAKLISSERIIRR